MTTGNGDSMDNAREEITRRAGRAFEAAAERLIDRGVTEAEAGSAMVAAGLSLWCRAIGIDQVMAQLASLTSRMAEIADGDDRPDNRISH